MTAGLPTRAKDTSRGLHMPARRTPHRRVMKIIVIALAAAAQPRHAAGAAKRARSESWFGALFGGGAGGAREVAGAGRNAGAWCGSIC
jgi:hypothetical protein